MEAIRNVGWIRSLNSLKSGVALALLACLFWSTPSIVAPDLATTPAQDNEEWIAAWVDDLKNSSERWIQIDLSEQLLTAWEGDVAVYSILISTGRDGETTPTGVFDVQAKYLVARMQGETYDIPDVPFVMYYYGNYAIHGAYWHESFGYPVSSGCINVAVDHAAWLFDWSALGTPVVVQY
ncbi:MAG: L,D-transpeptidase [Cyanobacteria bacterium CRU_2_1]|nr:L,D-transpeptidase [Cyanobacteria bacterium CRU_2_1]